MKRSNPGDINPWKAAGLVGALGADLVVCILAGYFAGVYLSKWTGGGQGWVAGGVIVGLAVGIISIVFLIKRVLEDSND
jgi:ATP synthase protein I